jgi:hypothetical protein
LEELSELGRLEDLLSHPVGEARDPARARRDVGPELDALRRQTLEEGRERGLLCARLDDSRADLSDPVGGLEDAGQRRARSWGLAPCPLALRGGSVLRLEGGGQPGTQRIRRPGAGRRTWLPDRTLGRRREQGGPTARSAFGSERLPQGEGLPKSRTQPIGGTGSSLGLRHGGRLLPDRPHRLRGGLARLSILLPGLARTLEVGAAAAAEHAIVRSRRAQQLYVTERDPELLQGRPLGIRPELACRPAPAAVLVDVPQPRELVGRPRDVGHHAHPTLLEGSHQLGQGRGLVGQHLVERMPHSQPGQLLLAVALALGLLDLLVGRRLPRGGRRGPGHQAHLALDAVDDLARALVLEAVVDVLAGLVQAKAHDVHVAVVGVVVSDDDPGGLVVAELGHVALGCGRPLRVRQRLVGVQRQDPVKDELLPVGDRARLDLLRFLQDLAEALALQRSARKQLGLPLAQHVAQRPAQISVRGQDLADHGRSSRSSSSSVESCSSRRSRDRPSRWFR